MKRDVKPVPEDVVAVGRGRAARDSRRDGGLLEREPAWQRFCEEVAEFLGVATPAAEDTTFASLSPREREILARLTEGVSNAEIAERLGVSEKTVRNHLSNLFDKLGVWSRARHISSGTSRSRPCIAQ